MQTNVEMGHMRYINSKSQLDSLSCDGSVPNGSSQAD